VAAGPAVVHIDRNGALKAKEPSTLKSNQHKKSQGIVVLLLGRTSFWIPYLTVTGC